MAQKCAVYNKPLQKAHCFGCSKCEKWCHITCAGVNREKFTFNSEKLKKADGKKWLCNQYKSEVIFTISKVKVFNNPMQQKRQNFTKLN